jgi:hypothetical protein
MIIRDVLIRLIGARDPNCPGEDQVLAYSENRLSSSGRAQLELHFANCSDCLEVLAFLGRDTRETAAPPTEEAVAEQTGRVLGYIRNDTLSHREPEKKVKPAGGFYISYPKLATVGLVISAIAIAGVWGLIGGKSPSDEGMEALTLAVAKERRVEPRISGGLPYSRYAGTVRGDDQATDEIHFDRAQGKVKAAASTSDVKSQLVLARSWLARGMPENANKAVPILNQILQSGVETPEVLNDLGVARFELSDYDGAITYFTRALAASPSYHEALFNRALALGHLNRAAEARQDWEQFIKQSTDENWKNEARTRLAELTAPSLR